MGSCCIDYDPPEFFTSTMRKARKQHKCCECGGIIEYGEQYQYISGMWDGCFYTFKTCEKCEDLRDSLMDVDCPSLGDLRECYMEYLSNIGADKYDDEKDQYYFPENHMRLNRWKR